MILTKEGEQNVGQAKQLLSLLGWASYPRDDKEFLRQRQVLLNVMRFCEQKMIQRNGVDEQDVIIQIRTL